MARSWALKTSGWWSAKRMPRHPRNGLVSWVIPRYEATLSPPRSMVRQMTGQGGPAAEVEGLALRVRVELELARESVDGADVARLHALHDPADAHHRRDAAPARHDGAVRGARAHLGDEPQHLAAVEHRGVARRQVVRDQDRRLLGGDRRARAVAEQVTEHAAPDIEQVGVALAQVLVALRLEPRRHRRHVAAEHERRVAPLAADGRLDRPLELGIVEDEQVGVIDLRLRRAELEGDAVADALEVPARGVERGAQALDLALDPLPRDGRVAHRQHLGLEADHRADADAGRGRDPGELHGSSPNRPSTRSRSAATASCSSGTTARTRIVLPDSAARSMTQRMLLPLTSLSSRLTKISVLYLPAPSPSSPSTCVSRVSRPRSGSPSTAGPRRYPQPTPRSRSPKWTML